MRILVTGGTGSVGKELVKTLLNTHEVTVFSRDEAKQHRMQLELPYDNLDYIIGDVRDYESVRNALRTGYHAIIHAAALKHVPVCDKFPFEAVKTNILGADNLVRAVNALNSKAILVGVSTDKAVYPTTAMGMTKALQEKLFIKNGGMIVRYGNLFTSRGSVIELFKKQIEEGGPVTVTHCCSTRFVMKLRDAVDIIMFAVENGSPGDIFVPNAKSVLMNLVAKVLIGNNKIDIDYIGLRPSEKLHEHLMTEEESYRSMLHGGFYKIPRKGMSVNAPKSYLSDSNTLSYEATKKFLKEEGIV